MDVLLGDDVAGEDAVHAPGTQLRLGVLRVFAQEFVHAVPRLAGLVVGFGGDDLADLAVVDGFDGVLVELVGAGLEIHQEAELVRGGLFAALGDGLAAGDVHGNGLGEIDVLAGINRGGGLLGMEIGRALDDDGVELLFQELAVARKAGVAVGGGDLKLLARSVGVVREVVRHRNEVVTAVLLEEVGDPFAAVAAADEADVDLRVGLGPAEQGGLYDRKGQYRGAGAGDETAAGDGIVVAD